MNFTFPYSARVSQVLGEIAGTLKAMINARVCLLVHVCMDHGMYILITLAIPSNTNLYFQGSETIVYLQSDYLPTLQMAPPVAEVS